MTPTTTNPDVAKPAIVAASTPNDMIRAMLADPSLTSTILSGVTGLLGGDKSMLQSKTFWAAILTPIVGALAARYAAGLDGATVGAITTVLTSAAMIAMRWVTKTPVTGIVTPASAS